MENFQFGTISSYRLSMNIENLPSEFSFLFLFHFCSFMRNFPVLSKLTG